MKFYYCLSIKYRAKIQAPVFLRLLLLICFFFTIHSGDLNAQATPVGGGPVQLQMAVTHCYTNIVNNDSKNGGEDLNSTNNTEDNKTEYRWRTSWRFNNFEYIVGQHECFALNRKSDPLYYVNDDNLTIYNPPGYLDVPDLTIFNVTTAASFDPRLYAVGGLDQSFGFFEQDVTDDCRSGSLTIKGSGGIGDIVSEDDYSIFFSEEIDFPGLTICNVPPMSGLGSDGRFYAVRISGVAGGTTTGAQVSVNYTPPAPEGVSVNATPCAGNWFPLEIDDSECRNLGGDTWNELYDVEIETAPGSGVFVLVCDNCTENPSIIIDKEGTHEIRVYGVSTASPNTRSLNYASTNVEVKNASLALVKDCPEDKLIEIGLDISPEVTGYANITDGCVSEITYTDITEPWECSGIRTIRTWSFSLGNQEVSTCVQYIDQRDLTPPELFCGPEDRVYIQLDPDFPQKPACSEQDFYIEITETLIIKTGPGEDPIPPKTIRRVWQHPYSTVSRQIPKEDFGFKSGGVYRVMERIKFSEDDIFLYYYDSPLMPTEDCDVLRQWERTFIAYDTCSNASSCSVIIQIREGPNPYFEVPDTVYDARTVADVIPDKFTLYYSPTRRYVPAEDFEGELLTCTGSSYSYQDFQDTGSPNTFRRNWIVVNNCGGTATKDQIITLDEVPYFPKGCDATVYLLPNGSRLFYPPAPEQLTNRATDLVTPDESLVYTWDKDLDRFYCEDINQVKTLDITATDEVGNQTTCTANITVVDTVAAEVRCKDLFIDLDENGLGTIDYLELFDVVTDNCLSRSEIIDSYSWNNDLLPLSVDCSHLGTHAIELNSTTDIYGVDLPKCTASITVRDPISPVITCRDTTFIISTETSKTFSLETLPINFVSDNCTDNSQLRFSWTPHDNFTCIDLGTTVFWVQVNDRNGNSARCEFNVNILEPEIEEQFTCRSRSFQLNSSNNYSYTIQPGDFGPSIRSFCSIPVSGAFTFSDDTDTFLDCEDIGEPNPVTLLFTPDDGSPTQTCITNVSVNEVSSPIFTCPSGIIDVDASFEDCGAYFEYDYTVTDECPIDIQLEEGLPSGSIFPVGWNNVKISARDKSGNYNACNFVVRVAGPTDKPTLTCPGNFIVQIPDGACEVVVNATPTYDFDYGCFTRNYQSSGQAMGSAFTPGTYPIEFRTENNFTNEFSRCSFNVTVRKDETPVAICKDTTLILTSKGGVSLQSADVDGGSYGDCYEVNNWALFDGRFFTSVFNCSKVGTKAYTLRVRNTAGATSTCTTNITLVPKDPDCQEELTINLDDTGIATLSAEDIFIDDNMCSGTLSLSQTTFDCSDVGQTQVVTLTRTIREFTGQCSTTISVEEIGDPADVTPPIALCQPDTTVYVGSDFNFLIPIEVVDAGSYDNESCQVDLVLGHPAYYCADLGPSEYTLYVTDASGNESTCTMTIIMADTLGPEITRCQDISIDLDASGNYTLTGFDINDAFQVRHTCLMGSRDYSGLQFDFDCTDAGSSIPMTIRTSDTHGNTSECNFRITVNDPSATCPSSDLVVSIKAILEGAYDSDVDLMHDNLRSLDLLPNIEPYGVTGAMLSSSMLSISGNDAIVDWVLVQLRDATDNTKIVYSRAALLQRDGDVVDTDGVSPVAFPDADFGNYYVAILHRNHLGLMTATTQSLSNTNITVDFTSSITRVYGTNSRIDLGGGLMAMYAADGDRSGSINANDRSKVWNERNQRGYLDSDCNLDGITNAIDRSVAWNNRNQGGTLPSRN